MRQLFGALFLFLLACPTLLARGVGEWRLGERGDTLRCALPMGSGSLPAPEGRLPRANEIRVQLPADTLSSCKKPKDYDGLWKVDFSAYGLIPRRQKVEDRWRNIPEDCRIDWRRKRERPIWDFLMDVATFFNTFDTTYVQRDRYAAQVQLYNTHFLQLIRLTGSDAEGHSQSLVFSPAHWVKIGPYVTWHGISFGYSFGVVPDRYKSKATEWTVAAYNSKMGFDFSYVASRGNFNLLRASGIEGVDNAQIKEVRFPAMRTHTLAVNAYYVFNYRHFSYPAAFSLSTVQLRSAGSWLLGARYDDQALHFDAQRTESFIKSLSPKAELIEALRVDKINYRQLGVSLGYAYNWVPWRGWLFLGSVAPALGYKYQRGETFSTQTLWRNIENFNFDCIFRFGIVRTNGRYYAGVSTVSYLYDYGYTHFKLRNSIHYIKLYVGFNFSRLPMFRGEKRAAKAAVVE